MKSGWDAVRARITVIVDNTIMELIPGNSFIQRQSMPNNSYLCEHGFSVLIEAEDKKILVDTGATGIAVTHNLNLLGIRPADIDIIVLSHGHNDHAGGLCHFPARIITHPDAFFKRYLISPTGDKYDLTCADSNKFKDRVDFHTGPVQLAKGVWTTGEIQKRLEWETFNRFIIERNGINEHDAVMDDQGVIINSSQGLVVVAGCSHAGIISTIEQAINLSGNQNVYCVIGGFHLIGTNEARISKTIEEFRRLKVKKIVPIHCTGFEGIKKISIEMPDEFEYVTTGCRLSF